MKCLNSIPRTRLQRWNRRQRKKLRIGEFQELGFELALAFASPLDDMAYNVFLDAFIEFIESIDLCVSGLGGALPLAETEGFISTFDRGTVTPTLQTAVVAWCQARPEVVEASAGELVDTWHGWGEA